MTKTGLEFGILVIVICLIFVIWDLEFPFLQYSLGILVGQSHRTLPAPGGSELREAVNLLR